MTREQSKNTVIKARLVAKRESDYSVYVFENLDADPTDWSSKYIMCTKCPNWESPEIEDFEEGYLEFLFVNSGTDKWYSHELGEWFYYRYSANYFQSFVPITHVVLGGVVSEKKKLVVT